MLTPSPSNPGSEKVSSETGQQFSRSLLSLFSLGQGVLGQRGEGPLRNNYDGTYMTPNICPDFAALGPNGVFWDTTRSRCIQWSSRTMNMQANLSQLLWLNTVH